MAPGALHLGVVADSPQQPVCHARGAAGAGGNGAGSFVGDGDGEDPRRADDDLLQGFGGVVVLQPVADAEAVTQRRGQQARAGRGADQRERRQVGSVTVRAPAPCPSTTGRRRSSIAG